MKSKQNDNFICPVCGGVEEEHEQGHLIIYSAVKSRYDLQMISVGICSKCSDGAFEAIQKSIHPDRFKQEYYC